MAEPEFAMESDRGVVVAVADHCHHLLPGAGPTALVQRRKQRAAEPKPAAVGGDVYGIFDSEAIGAAAAVGCGVAVTDHAPVDFGNQIGKTVGADGAPALRQLLRTWRRL